MRSSVGSIGPAHAPAFSSPSPSSPSNNNQTSFLSSSASGMTSLSPVSSCSPSLSPSSSLPIIAPLPPNFSSPFLHSPYISQSTQTPSTPASNFSYGGREAPPLRATAKSTSFYNYQWICSVWLTLTHFLSKAWKFISRITSAVFQLDSQLKNGSASASSSSSSSGSSNRGAVTKKRKTLVLDLDETLIHSTIKTTEQGFDYQVPVTIENISYIFYIFKRPHVEYFLEKVSEWFDVVIFTASLKQYAAPVIERLDTKRLVKGVLYRESCVLRNGNLIKDLGFAGFDVATTIIIDNSPIAYSLNKENAIPIDHFLGNDPNDQALLKILPLLEVLRFASDVRPILRPK